MMRSILVLLIVVVVIARLTRVAVAQPKAVARAVPTFECMGLYWKTDKGSEKLECAVQYRKKGDQEWQRALPAWFDKREKEYRGSIVALSPDTAYEIELSLEGGLDSAKLTARTWSEEFPIAQTIKVKGKKVTITKGGSPEGYVLYIPSSSEPIGSVKVEASYVVLRGLVVRGAKKHGIVLGNVHHVVIEECDISGWGRKNSQGFGVNMDSGISSASTKLSHIVVQRNRIHHPRYSANDWTQERSELADLKKNRPIWKGENAHKHSMGPQAISWWNSRGNHVIRYNSIYSDDQHAWNDAMGHWSNFDPIGFPGPDTDIYGNAISHAFDDGIEAEGGGCNVRIWGNYLDMNHQSIATVTVVVGPLYVFRNVVGRVRNTPEFKHHNASRSLGKIGSHMRSKSGYGRQYWFHNTILWPLIDRKTGVNLGANVGIGATSDGITELVSHNNILHVDGEIHRGAGRGDERISFTSTNGFSIIADFKKRGSCVFDYDLYNGEVKFPYDGIEEHGIKGVPIYAEGHGPVSGPRGMYQLSPESPGFDAAKRIPNFNDGFRGKGPDIGAHETGSPRMEFGVDAYRSRQSEKIQPAALKRAQETKIPRNEPAKVAGKHNGKGLDLSQYKLEKIYEEDFSGKVAIIKEKELLEGTRRVKLPENAGWVLEGQGDAFVKDGRMVVINDPVQDKKKSILPHVVLWNTSEFPADFLLEFDMSPKDSNKGLAIIFFSAKGRDGKDIFALNKKPRLGDFKRYHSGDIDCYHVSYWAIQPGDLTPRKFANLRKNYGFKKVASGKDRIWDQGPGPHKVRILKVGGTIQLETRGEIALNWTDDGKKHGKILEGGHIGFRTMSHTDMVSYDNVKVFKIIR